MHAIYSERNFDWRISTATVEVEHSTFSKLEGYTRFITTLDGSMLLQHKDHHNKKLEPFEIDRFDGGWETESFGCVTDFNLMVKHGIQAEMLSLDCSEGDTIESKKGINAFYFLSNGKIMIDKLYNVEKYDLLITDDINQIELIDYRTFKLLYAYIKI